MKKIIVLFLLITSCAAPSLDKRIDYINELNNNKFTEFVYQDTFAIYSLQKINNNEEVVVYIEGDGLSWIDRFTPSSDPTPKNPLAFKLAKLDPNQNVIYLARPCQYVQKNRAPSAHLYLDIQAQMSTPVDQVVKLDTSLPKIDVTGQRLDHFASQLHSYRSKKKVFASQTCAALTG